jgi:polar amino acid transport system substrate-binding protein
MSAHLLPSKILRLLSILGVLTAGFSGLANAAQTHEFRACSLPLPPQTMLDQQGQPDGFAVKVLQAVAEQLGWSVKIAYMPWIRVVESAKQGRCDLVLTALQRGDYATYMTFPQTPVLYQNNVLLVRRHSAIQFDGDLERFMRNHSVGLYRDKAVDERFEVLRRQPWARIVTSNNAKQNLERLTRARFDAAIENQMTAVYELQALGRLDQVEFLSPPLNITPAYITFPHAGRAQDKVAEFDAALSRFKTSAAFKAIEKRYLSLQ